MIFRDQGILADDVSIVGQLEVKLIVDEYPVKCPGVPHPSKKQRQDQTTFYWLYGKRYILKVTDNYMFYGK